MVKNPQCHSGTPSIYPGIYQPVFTKQQEVVKIKGSKPPVNIIEFPDYYEIEMPAPGFQKGDFFIKTYGCSLLVVGYKKCFDKMDEAHYHQHGFQCKYVTRTVDLPNDADTEFGTAEYKNGVLYIYLYKTGCPVQNHQNCIIVY
jgi:HSP20 family protein